MAIFYTKEEFQAENGTTIPSGTDVGWYFNEYHKRTLEEGLTRLRTGLITNGDGTYDWATGVYQEDGTYIEVDAAVDLPGIGWAADFNKVAAMSYGVSMTRAEFDDFVNALGV